MKEKRANLPISIPMSDLEIIDRAAKLARLSRSELVRVGSLKLAKDLIAIHDNPKDTGSVT